MRLGLRVALLAVFALSAAIPAFAADPPWFEVRSPNFVVYTDAGEKRGREVALRFEQMRAIFGQLFQKAKVEVGVPLKIVAFRNTKGIRQVAPVFEGKAVEVAGLFLAGDGVTFIALDLSSYNPWEVVFHEYGHMLLNANSFDAPLWFDEGFAEYYSTIRVDKNEYSMGVVPERVPNTLLDARFLPVVDLFSVNHESPVYNKGDHRSVFYAQSWLAVHYLRSQPQLSEKLGKYLGLLQQKVPVREAIQGAFGDPKLLDKELEKHFRVGQAMVYRIKLPDGLQGMTMAAKAMDALDARAVVGEFRLQSRHHQEAAMADFRAVLAARPDHPIALRGLGYAMLRQREWEQAGEYFRRAAAQDSTDPRVHYLSAMLVYRQGISNAEARAQMRKALERALELDANYADAHGLLGITYAMDRDMQKAVAATRRALELQPRQEVWLMNLANHHIALQEWDQAAGILQRITGSAQPQIAENAAKMLQMVARMRENPGRVAVGPLREREPGPIRGNSVVAQTDPAGDTEEDSEGPSQPASAPSPQPETPAMANVLRFFSGTLLKVECGANNRAVFTIQGTQKQFTITATDLLQVSFGGKQRFSCNWRDVRVKGFFRADPEKGYLLEAIEVE